MISRRLNGIRNIVPASWLVGGLAVTAICVLAGGGCDSTQTAGAPKPLFPQLGGGDGERWTIRCMHINAPGHAEYAYQLAEALKKVEGIRPQSVRLATDAASSAIYYGEYTKTPSESGRLIFPPEYQRDLQFIRRLAMGQRTPFAYAGPELISKPAAASSGELDIRSAKGAYTLQIAVFYNTAGFSQREEAAIAYVRLLRERGYPAYLWHDQNRSMSYVYVGDFEQSDVITENGVQRYGPRVEQFIKSNEAEFRNISENGQIIRRQQLDGKLAAPQTYLVPVPRGTMIMGASPAPGEQAPAQPRPLVP